MQRVKYEVWCDEHQRPLQVNRVDLVDGEVEALWVVSLPDRSNDLLTAIASLDDAIFWSDAYPR